MLRVKNLSIVTTCVETGYVINDLDKDNMLKIWHKEEQIDDV